MNKKYLLIILLLCSFIANTYATPYSKMEYTSTKYENITYPDSLATKKVVTIFNTIDPKDSVKTKEASKLSPLLDRWKKESTSKIEQKTITTKKFKSFPELEQYNSNLSNTVLSYVAEFTKEYLAETIKVDNNTQKVLDAGKEVFDIIEQEQRFINIIGGNEVIDLPVGIKQSITQNSYITLGIISMEYHPNYTVVDMFAKVKLGELGAELFFGANDVKISKDGGIYDEARLNLLADFPVAQNGGQWLLTFKGGMDTKGNADEQSYITIDCQGKVKEIAIEADIRVAKTIAIPLNEDGSVKFPGKTDPRPGESPVGNETYLGVTTRINILEGAVIQVDLPMFGLKAIPNWGFKMENTVLDLSDTINAPDIEFPELYKQQGLLVEGNENLWRGFHSSEVRVTLPAEFKKKGSTERITIGARNLFIDNFGVSGDFYALNVLDINEGDASKWQFSVDSIGVDLKVNRFIKAGFNGEIVLPISEADSLSGGTLAYKGLITADQYYSVNVDAVDDVSFDIFKAKAKIFRGSYIKLEVENSRFYPEANLTGLMSFNKEQKAGLDTLSTKSLNDSTDIEGLEFEGLSFQDFKIQTKNGSKLTIGYAGFKDSISLPKIAGFELGFYDIDLTSNGTDVAELGLNSYINLDNKGIHGDVRLRIIGELEDGDYLKWRYKKTEIDSVQIDVKRKSFEFKGKLHFFRENPIYGKGFAGNLDLYSESLGLEIGARGLFGSVDDYRYWFVDANGRPTTTENENLTIFDLGGGVYHHMRKAGMNEEATSLSGINYQPDKTTSLGFKALAAFEIKSGATFTGLVGIEMSFNSEEAGGGVSRVGFYGAASLITGTSSNAGQYPFGSVDEMQAALAAKEQSMPEFHTLSLDKEGIAYFSENVFPSILTGEELFAAQLGIDFDFRNKTYWGMCDVFLNAGKIRGEGEKNRLGYLEFYNAPDDWYIYVGTPTKRFGLQGIPIGPVEARFNLYYMTGTILPEPAAPPQNVIDILHLTGDELIFGRNFDQELAQGTGYAFGAKFEIGKSFDWGIIYADVAAGAGFDLMLRDFGDTECKGREGTLGMDGWYAIGQTYAYLQGKIGVEVKLLGFQKKIPVLKAGIAILAQAQLPNPVFIKGYAGIDIKVLGTINIHSRIKVIIGEECEMIGKTGLQEFVMISDITPRDGLTDVDVFDAIQVAFNAPIGTEMQIEDDEGLKTYRINLKEIQVKNETVEILGETSFTNENSVLLFDSNEVLPPEKEIFVSVSVSFEEKINGNWQILRENGEEIVEIKEVSFTTGKAPKKIHENNIVNMYPIIDQKYMLIDESSTGFVQLDKGQEYLFGNGYSDELYFIDETGNKTKANFTYNPSEKRLDFEIPDLNTTTTYTYALITMNPKGDDDAQAMTSVEFEEIADDVEISSNTLVGNASGSAFISRLNYTFKTSAFTSFKNKMRSLKITQSITSADSHSSESDGIYNVGKINLKMDDFEPFEISDLIGSRYTDNTALIQYKATLNDSYYRNKIRPLIYNEYPLDNDINFDRDTTILGVPPVRALKINTAYLYNAEINPNDLYLRTHFPYRYHLPIAYHSDFIDLQYEITRRYVSDGIINQEKYNNYKYLIYARFPFMNREKYEVIFEYVIPSKGVGTHQEIKYENTF